MNQDGHTNGISLPSPEAQARLVRDACTHAGIDPRRVGYVEAHGTGTAVGDPIEAHALAEALCKDRPADAPLPIGSVKTNLGHLETAAGVAGLLKAMLVLEHGQIPPSLHFRTPNPHIDFEALKLRVPVGMEPFPQTDGPRIAGVNSFGFGGANAHVLLVEPPTRKHTELSPEEAERSWPITLSARSEAALRASAGQLGAWIDEHMRSNGHSPLLPDLAYTLGARRNHHPHRITLVSRDTDEVIRELANFATGQASQKLRDAFSPRREKPARIAFVMSGQGPQWWGMGRELMRREPVFRRTMEACEAALRPWTRFSLLEELGRDEESSQMHRTEIAQPAIFAMQIALAELWKSWGVQPAAIVGHSVGEIAATCAAGILTLEDAARVIAQRARFMEECARGEGTMLAVGLAEEEARDLILRHDRTVSIAAFNGPRSLTLSGPRLSLEAIAAELEPQNIFARFVRVDHPFHHPLMQPASEALEASLADLAPRTEGIPFFSTVTGARCAGESCTAEHWGRGIRQPVQFAPAVAALADFGVDVWLELSAHPALALSIQECLAPRGAKPIVFSSARREREHESLLETAMDLHRASVELDFVTMIPSRNQLSLPAYAWDRSRWWHESHEWREGRLAAGGRGLLDVRLPRATPTWSARLDGRHMAFLKDHKVESHVVFPAAAFVEMALEAGQQLFEGRPFAIEDFEIRRPLLVPDPPSNLQLELTCDADARTFTIQSRQGGAWTTHVVGSLRGERTDFAFVNASWASSPEFETVAVEDFYAHMSDLGLRYGEEFRAVRELSTGTGEAAGRVALSEAISRRAKEYALHPVLLDGALHVFSAGAATVEGRRSCLKLPVRFSRIQFLRTPGAACRVQSHVCTFNDELLEGDVALFDSDGRPCVLVSGFRAISMAAARRSGAPGSARDLVYRVEWERSSLAGHFPTPPPLPLEQMHATAAASIEEIVATRDRSRLESALAAKDELAAALLTDAFRKLSDTQPFTAESLGIVESQRAIFARLTQRLIERGLLEQRDDLLCVVGDHVPPEQALRDFIEAHPGHLPEAQLCATMCTDLGPILRGEKEAVQALFNGAGAETLEQFYGDGLFASHWMAGIARAVSEAARNLPDGRGLRILEVGAGTGGLAACVLPMLERGRHTYVFSDISPAFFSTAAQKLAAFPEVEFKPYDLDKPAVAQDFEAGAFDIILGTNVLHAVADVRATLRQLHDLLTPGGTLLFTDLATPQLWTESTFGLTSGWWRFTDRDLRPEQPLLAREQWEAVLRECGFREALSLPGFQGPLGEGQIGLLARKAWTTSSTVEEIASPTPVEKSWLIVADSSDLAGQLATRLQAAGAQCVVTRSEENWSAVLSNSVPERVVWLRALDEPSDDVLLGTDALLQFVQAFDTARPTSKLSFDLVTRSAQAVGSNPVAVAQAPLIGLFRVVLSEHPHFSCRAIDLPPTADQTDADQLWNELLREDAERETALRDEARYVQRLTRGLPEDEKELPASTPLRLESRERGSLDALRLSAFTAPECGPDEVLIEVKAAGMNFRDVLKALGLYPAETADARMFGDEVAGVVRAIGANVENVAPGERVFGLAVHGLATHALARAADVRRIPDGLSFEEASTLPVVFMTAWHALESVARVRPGERVLVHAGAGGVGMAAIQIAQHLGAEVIATAGSPTKRALLETLGVKHVIDSRRADFADAVMALTGGRGVDIVLNSLAGEAIPMGLACLAEFGRFIEIGKRDIYQNSRIPLWPLRRNASFHVVAMDAVFHGDAELTRRLLGEIATRVESGALRPPPFRAFPACRIDAAFRLMAQGKHTGKIVVSFAEPFLVRRGKPPVPEFAVKPDASYLITGAFGGFGRVLARWLVECGARHLVLASRGGASTPDAAAFVEELRGRGVEIQIEQVDVSSSEDVSRMIAHIERPLRGIFHLAMVIDDAPLAALTPERMATVLAPKARGAWLLHEATRDRELDCFVMFSSVSSIFGNPAQGNYAAANAFLDALAHHRRALGLPALAVNWGVLGGEGYVARNERVAEFLARQGTAALLPGEVVRLLESFLADGAAQVAAIRVDWSKWRQSFRGLQENPLLERIFASGVEDSEAGVPADDWRQKLAAAAPDEREEIVGQAVRAIIASVLRVKPESLRDDQPLTDLGLDSLMGAEIETSIDSALGVGLPPASLLRARTIGQIRVLIVEHMGGTPAANAAPKIAPPVAEVTASDAVDLEALSDEDIDRLLEPEKTHA